jgi:hypothetical protein
LLHLIVQFDLLRKCGLLAHTSAAFLKNCCTEKLLVACGSDFITYSDFYFILQKGGDCMSEKFEKLRFRVAKTRRAKYISHLDFVRCVQRAIRRSGLPVHYTNGFHPHMEAVFATALPLGMESIGEVLEIRFAEPVEPEAARTCLQAALPEGN